MHRAATDDSSGWTLADHLLTELLYETQKATWQRGGGQGPKPEPIPRPGVEEAKPPSPEQLAAAKARMAYRFAREE